MTTLDQFAAFWTAYPSRNGVKAEKKAALDWWMKHKPDDGEVQAIMLGLARYKQTDQWQRGFVPDAIRFLRHRRWEDELSEKPGQLPDEPMWERQARVRSEASEQIIEDMRRAAQSARPCPKGMRY